MTFHRTSSLVLLPLLISQLGSFIIVVEGAASEDGRTPSIWDTFAREGYANGATGDIAVDQYHKYKEDVKLMAEMGLDAYRFSISWSRLIPNGRGPVNPKGLQYYNNLINELISHGIQAHVTLTHYDLPQALEDEYGGWINRKIVKDFTTYADVCFREFGDRVAYWITINEPGVFAVGSYDQGVLPPRHCSSPFGVNCTRGNSSTEPYIAVHNILLAHASAAKLYKKKYQGKQHGFIGISVYTTGNFPLTSSAEDKIATRRANDFFVGWIVNPLVFGDYPATMKEIVGSRLPTFSKHESELVKGSFDFLGVIHYSSYYVQDDSASWGLKERDYNADLATKILSMANASLTNYELPILPLGMQAVLEYFKQVYGNPPIFIVENGQRTRRNTTLEDTWRVNYLHAYMGSVLDAIRNGSNTRGYFVWSFLDVLELLDGYESSYGFYYVDLEDPYLKRQPKLSSHWYSRFLKGESISSEILTNIKRNFSALSPWPFLPVG